jgi:hypothetical protein
MDSENICLVSKRESGGFANVVGHKHRLTGRSNISPTGRAVYQFLARPKTLSVRLLLRFLGLSRIVKSSLSLSVAWFCLQCLLIEGTCFVVFAVILGPLTGGDQAVNVHAVGFLWRFSLCWWGCFFGDGLAATDAGTRPSPVTIRRCLGLNESPIGFDACVHSSSLSVTALP